MNNDQNPITSGDNSGDKNEQTQVRLRIDETKLNTTYANAFRASENAEEVILDFGLNTNRPANSEESQPEIIFSVNERVIMNYYSAKRLALTLGQIISRHEQMFGTLEMDVTKRRKPEGK